MRRWLLLSLVMFFYVYVSTSLAQDAEPVFQLSDEYITEWLIMGPLFPSDLNTDFLSNLGGEANIQPKEGEAVITSDGRRMTWKRYKAKTNVINLLEAIGSYENAVAYAFCIIQSQSATDARMYTGSDDGIAVWLNGIQVHFHNVQRALFDKDIFGVKMKSGANRCLVKVSQMKGGWGFTARIDSSQSSNAIISGMVTDEVGQPISNAVVTLKQDERDIAQTRTDASGAYNLSAFPAQGSYDLFAVNLSVTSGQEYMVDTPGDLGDWRPGILLREGERQQVNLVLRKAISIEGAVVMLDDTTPHAAITVQAIIVRAGDPETWPVVTVLSDERGKYRFVNLKPGRYYVRCHIIGKNVYYVDRGKTTLVASHATSLMVGRGRTIRGVDFRIPPFKKGVWRNYTYLNGLMNDAIRVIHRDSNGNLWFGTSGGVSRYDGKQFTNFITQDLESPRTRGSEMSAPREDELAGNWVNAIHSDPDGTMWFGTWSGVSRYDGKKFVNLTTQDGLVSNFVNAIYRDPDGILWFATGWTDYPGGISRYDGKGFVNFTSQDGLANDAILSICRDRDGALWFGTFGGGVSRYDGKGFVNFTAQDGLPNNYVISIHGDRDGNLWFGTLLGGVSRYDGKSFVTFTTRHGLASNTVSSIYSDPYGVLWFGTGYTGVAGGGVSRYDGKTFINFTMQDGLAHNSVRAIYGDPDGVLWFGTEDGVSQYDGNTFINFNTRDGLANNVVNFIYCDPYGTWWFGTEGGASWYDGYKFVNLTTKNGLPDSNVRFVYQASDDALWFGTRWGGISCYKGRRFFSLTESDGLLSNQTLAGYAAPDGTLWFGTYGGVSHYDGKEFVNFTQKDGLPNNPVASIYGDSDGILWFGTLGGGVSRYGGKGFTGFTIADGLASDSVISICRDNSNSLWFGTLGSGVSRYDGKAFTNFTAQDGLIYDQVGAIYCDKNGVLWFGTLGGGIAIYDGSVWSSLDTRDGLAGNKVFSINQDPDGSLWFGTDGGITHYYKNTTPPKVSIYSARTGKHTYTDLTAISGINARENIAIEYNAMDFKTVPEKRQYRVRIKGINSDWQRPTKATQFDWKPKKSGKFTFEVQAIDRDLNYSEPASMEIKILPFFLNLRLCLIAGAVIVVLLTSTVVYFSQRGKRIFEPIPNPYIAGDPIHSREMFFGKAGDFEFIRMRLGAGQPGALIVFTGQRKSGKTSVLLQILNGELGERFIPVLIDMPGLTINSEAEFFGKIAAETNDALAKAGLKPAYGSAWEATGDPIQEFQQFIDQTTQALEGRMLLLMFDEYEMIETKIDEGIIRPDIIKLFASLLETNRYVSFVFTGSKRLGQGNPIYWRSLIGKCLYRYTGFLSPRDSMRLVTEPLKDRVIFPRGIPERIIRLTAGQPFYTQLVCKGLTDRLNEEQRNRVRQGDIDLVAQNVASNPPAWMMHLWDGLSPEQQGVISSLGELLGGSDRYASAPMLLNFAQEKDLTTKLELSGLERILDELFVNEVLERERAGAGQYEYRFRMDLMRIWLLQAYIASHKG